MATESAGRGVEAKMDATSLYREEIYTDRAAGTQIMTNMGPIPISFEIDGKTLGEAVQKYGEAAKEGIENAVRELQEMRRQQSSSILVPGQTPGLGAGLPPVGGGKIKLG